MVEVMKVRVVVRESVEVDWMIARPQRQNDASKSRRRLRLPVRDPIPDVAPEF